MDPGNHTEWNSSTTLNSLSLSKSTTTVLRGKYRTHMVFNAFHNMFMDLIASQGIIGFIMFIGIMIASLCYLIRYYKNISEKNKLACIFLFSACSSIVVSSLFVSQILYVNNQITVLFWILWGFLIYFVKKGE